MISRRTMMLTAVLLASITIMGVVDGKRGVQRNIQILNESDRRVEVFWVNVNTREEVLMSAPYIFPGADFSLNSYIGHEFMLREMPDAKGQCKETECKAQSFQISDNDEQLVRVDDSLEAAFVDNQIEAQQQATRLLQDCQTHARAKIEAAQQSGDSNLALQAMEDLVGCVEKGVSKRLEVVNEEIAFQAQIRTDIAASLENYTCVDDTLESSESVHTEQWVQSETNLVTKDNPHAQVSRTVDVKLDRPASRIHLIHNFILPDECQAMQDAAASSLHSATVADGKGGSRLSENRKAKQAGIKVPWSQEPEDDPIARLSRRVYDYTNHVLGLGIQEHGQEDLMSIQYFGRGLNDTEPDRYTPHCDGECTGLSHKHGTRMATMVMYCDVPEKGGHTNFRNSGVHIKPTSGAGIFFSYIDPETRLMDKGFTEHSGCPVFEGTKRIVTQWVRFGVDSENTWDSFNTLGIKKSEVELAENYDEDAEGDEAAGEDEGDEAAGDDEL